jgi:hypothetical protein
MSRRETTVVLTVSRVENGYTVHKGGAPWKGEAALVYVAATEGALDDLVSEILEEVK